MNRVEELIGRAARWLALDPDPITRAQLAEVVRRGEPDELEELVGRELEFGTAGLRGPLGPGPNRMNRLVARRTASGLASHLCALERSAPQRHASPGIAVVVGHDARHGSAEFAEEIVNELIRHGMDVTRFDGPVPTPLVAFVLLEGGHDAGVVVTASHNPAADNGIKVFGPDGAQIAPPVDASIAGFIESPLEPIASEPGEVRSAGSASAGDAAERYVARAVALARPSIEGAGLRVAYTALHGVGAELLETVLGRIGVLDCHAVAAQRAPDPDFPTAPRPNPEEPGVLGKLLSLADAVDADLALALDPDADRLAVAVRGARGRLVLTGDELGVLFAGHLIDTTEPASEAPAIERLITSTIVSSRLVGRICESRGVHHVETRTGFKWLCRPGLERPDRRQLLMYEEALGYGIGADARDKDGITAAAVACVMYVAARRAGRSLLDMLDDLAALHGAFVTRNGAIRTERVDALRSSSLVLAPDAPDQLGGTPVVSADQPAPAVIRWHLEDETRVILRPSGTEPKLKYYCEAIEPLRGRTPADARAAGSARLDAVVQDLLALVREASSGA